MVFVGACGGGREDTAPRAAITVPAGSNTRPQARASAGAAGDRRGASLAARLEFPPSHGRDAKPQALLAIDLDGDGKDELVGATMAPGTLQIWSGLSPAIRPLAEPRVIPIGDYSLGPVWLGGRKPASKTAPALVAVASRTALELAVYDLRAEFARASDAPPVKVSSMKLDRRPRVMASGDLDGDGSNEIALVTIDDDVVLVRTDTDVRHMRLCDDHATCAHFLADGGGLVFGFQGTRRVVIYVKSTMPQDVNPLGFEPGPAVSLPGLPRAIDEVDLDGDGDTELVVAGGDKSLWIFGLGRAGGWKTWFDEPPIEVETGVVPMDVAHADFDGDGKSDLLCVSLYGQECALYSGASFTAPRDPLLAPKAARFWREYAGQHPTWGAIGDFDGDGALDVAISNPGANRVSVLFGDGHGGVYASEHVAAGRSPSSIASGDLDGDGLPDVVGLNALDGTLSVYRNANGVLQAGEAQGPANTPDCVRCADVDGDGHLDAAFLQHPDQCSLVVFFGDGKGHLAPRADVPPLVVGTGAGDLLFADLAMDGNLEALIADPVKNRIALVTIERRKGERPNLRTPRFVDMPGGPRALALVSDRHGAAPTIAVALGGPGEPRGIAFLSVARDHGEVVLAPTTTLRTSEFPIALAVADLDGDGDLDLALLATQAGGDSAAFVIPCLHAKSGEWRALERMPTGLRAYAIAAGDMDGDGRAEILVSAQNSHHVNLWTKIDSGFARCADIGVGTGPLGLALVDLDRDGRPELVVASAFSSQLDVVRLR
jgi:hypothetical protein